MVLLHIMLIYLQTSGRDVEELFEQHQKEVELAKQYGIEIAYQPFWN